MAVAEYRSQLDYDGLTDALDDLEAAVDGYLTLLGENPLQVAARLREEE